MIDTKHWLRQAQRIDADDAYTYADLASDLVARLGWTTALNVATALRGYVYSQAGRSELHTAVRPIYEALGWEQAALLAAWFRDTRNRPGTRPQERPSGRRPGGWPGSTPTAPSTTSTREENQWESGTT